YSLEIQKSSALAEASKEEFEVFGKLRQGIESRIVDTKKEISELQERLLQEKTIRRQREEYDELSRAINQLPPKVVSRQEVATLQERIAELEAEQKKVLGQVEIRDKQFALLLATSRDIQNELEEEKEEKDAMLEEEEDEMVQSDA
ncbi:unnamed protein product, partial [Chrysoparadoxa australica]